VRPGSALLPQVARWLLLNRQGSRWYSTRDTAHAIYALAAYAKQAGETAPDLSIEASLGGVTRSFRVTPETALAFDDTLVVGDDELGAGRRTLRLRVSGRGAAYFSASLRYFTREEDIRGAGTTLRLKREYFRRVPRVVEEGGTRRLVHDLEPVASLGSVKSGDEVEVKLTIEAPTAYDHLVFEDPKPAGFEPIDLVSGSRYGDGLCSNMELRDERVAFFITHLAQGSQVIRYVLRAETPGRYHALPARGYAMYAPEIAALSDEWRGGIDTGAALSP
jgi:alpha-2-macroglobulin